MTKKQKIALFFICAFFFLLSATIIVFYSQGIRIDFNPSGGGIKISKTGAFYFKVSPKSTEVYLDNQLRKKTDFFFDSVFIENLLPKKYNIKIKKEGYSNWEKNLEIKKTGVTEVKNIILIKEQPNFFILNKGVEKIFFSPDETKIVLLELQETGWEIKLYNLKSNVKTHLIQSLDVAKGVVVFLDLSFSPDSKKILLKVKVKENLKYYLIDLGYNSSSRQFMISLDFLGKNVEDISFNPKDTQKLFFLKRGELAEADLIKKEISLSSLRNIFTWKVFNSNIYYLELNGYLFKTDFSFGGEEKITETNFHLKEDTEYEIIVFPDSLLLKENEDLYLFNPETKAFEKFFEKNKKLKSSPDLEKVVYSSDFELWILFSKEQHNQPSKKANEKLFLTRFSEKIGEIFWFGSHYLIFNSGNKIKIIEIDERDKINIVDLAEFKEPKIYFNQTDKKLYLLSDGNLFFSEKLIL